MEDGGWRMEDGGWRMENDAVGASRRLVFRSFRVDGRRLSLRESCGSFAERKATINGDPSVCP
jgi:hypothetical protein